MKLEREEPEEIQLNMTAMIDIVFQLLIFFIMTFKVVAQEADFNIKMPMASGPATDILEEPPELIRVKLRTGPEGVINSIQVDDEVETLTFGPDPELYMDLTN
jgi:biopolymer transport protein ExbD